VGVFKIRSTRIRHWIGALLVALSCVGSASTAGGELNHLQGSQIDVYFPPSLSPGARRVLESYPRLKAQLEGALGWHLDLRPQVVLVGDESAFRRMAESPLTIAFAVPRRDLIVMDYSRASRRPVDFAHTLKHELCHLLLHAHVPEGRLPRWLDEGVAQWVSDGISDILVKERGSVLNRVAIRGDFIPLASLSGSFPSGEDRLVLAYEESKGFVNYLIGQYGRDRVPEVLERMRGGASVEQAVFEVVGVPLADLETAWHQSVRQRISWFTLISFHVYEILFGLMALLAGFAFLLAMIRKRKAYRELE